MVKVGQYRHHSCLFFALFNEIYRKNRGIRTRITRVEGKLVDHLTTTMVQLKKLKIPIKLKPKFRRKGQKAGSAALFQLTESNDKGLNRSRAFGEGLNGSLTCLAFIMSLVRIPCSMIYDSHTECFHIK